MVQDSCSIHNTKNWHADIVFKIVVRRYCDKNKLFPKSRQTENNIGDFFEFQERYWH